VVDGAYVTSTTPTTLSEIVLEQWFHPYKMKFYNYGVAIYTLPLVETPKMQYQFCGYIAIPVFDTCSIQC
jgi:hypothetical protein